MPHLFERDNTQEIALRDHICSAVCTFSFPTPLWAWKRTTSVNSKKHPSSLSKWIWLPFNLDNCKSIIFRSYLCRKWHQVVIGAARRFCWATLKIFCDDWSSIEFQLAPACPGWIVLPSRRIRTRTPLVRAYNSGIFCVVELGRSEISPIRQKNGIILHGSDLLPSWLLGGLATFWCDE